MRSLVGTKQGAGKHHKSNKALRRLANSQLGKSIFYWV